MKRFAEGEVTGGTATASEGPELKRMSTMSNALDCLKKVSQISADTGDFGTMALYKPSDATTNPSLILEAVQMPAYADLVRKTIDEVKQRCNGTTSSTDEIATAICTELLVAFGVEVLKVIPGVVSTEVDSRLSFDTDGSVEEARRIIARYKELGVDKERVLIKLAATWEGCEAARILEKEGIHCNMTLIFDLAQAIAAAEAGATLVSPFVGRILDWHKNVNGKDYSPEADQDPGVISVRSIYNYYKCHHYKTVVMGASFRNKDEILALAGCDRLTISPKLLKELQELEIRPDQFKVPLTQSTIQETPKIHMDQKTFRWLLNENAMATEKLAEGIRKFSADTHKLKSLVMSKL